MSGRPYTNQGLEMNFLGIDFGWSGRPSGLAVLAWDGRCLQLLSSERRTGSDEILAWVDTHAGDGPALVAVDAPLVIPNATGMRIPDRRSHQLFGKYHAGCYPANLGRPYALRTLALGEALVARGFAHAPLIQPLRTGRYLIEVFPHPAIVQLFSLPRIIRYKKGVLANRRQELVRYRGLIQDVLTSLVPTLVPPDLPPVPSGGNALKELEDQLDALMCAYIVAYWWYLGADLNLVMGDGASGYIVVPQLTSMRHE
jgi:predicted RNase H-like nuclease